MNPHSIRRYSTLFHSTPLTTTAISIHVGAPIGGVLTDRIGSKGTAVIGKCVCIYIMYVFFIY